MDDIKVSVKKDEVKAAPAKKAAPKKTAEKRSSGILKLIIGVVITALAAGGGVYAWQSKLAESGVNRITQEARNARISLEAEMDSLKQQLNSKTEDINNLKKTQTDLEEKAKLLETAQKKFSNAVLGLDFAYPAVFGEVNLSITNASSGQLFLGTFSANANLVFGGIANNYNSTSSPGILQTQGFLKKSDKYYFENIGAKTATDYEIAPVKSLSAGGNEIILVNNASFLKASASSGPVFEIGKNGLAAIVNLQAKNFSGMVFWDKDIAVTKQADFENILQSIAIREIK